MRVFGGFLLALVTLLGACDAPRRKLTGTSSEPPTAQSASSASVSTASVRGSATASVAVANEGADDASHANVPAAPAITLKAGGARAVEGRFGMVSSEDVHATKIGVAVLEAGGNAIDAAVAVGYALSVTHHAAGSLGGGGFMIVRLASGDTHAIDYREIAPARATVALNEKQLAKGAHGYLSAPVPGVVAGLNLARERFGSKPLAELLAPSIALAEDGHAYGARQALVLSWYYKRLKDPTLRAIFGRGQGRHRPIGAGEILKQPSLAATLRAIASGDNAGFYQGDVAQKIARAMKKRGGLVSAQDLASYRALVREPLRFEYRGFEVFTMPPPSMGGIALLSLVNTLAASKAHTAAPKSAQSVHLFIEASRRAYADRRAVGADPAFVDQKAVGPMLARLVDPAYPKTRKPLVDVTRATPSSALTPIHRAPPPARESPDTTHFSVVDREGNAVAVTTTLSAAFGAWVVVPETGVFFSNAMGGFSPSGANVLQPGKRMASSMTPAIVVQGGKAVAVLGSPGGDTIPGTVAQVLRNLVDYQMTIDEAVEHARVHHQYKPDQVRLEQKKPLSSGVHAALAKLGHKLEASPLALGDANCVLIDATLGAAFGYADTRKGGLALGPTHVESSPSASTD